MAAGYNCLVLCDLADRDYTSALENVQKGLESEGELHRDLFCGWSDSEQFRCGDS